MKEDKMPQLFEVIIEDKDETKASNFIFRLTRKDFIAKNQVFIKNYIHADISIALSHIKLSYKEYVCGPNQWSEEKFEDIVFLIAKRRQMLTPTVFLNYGSKYDDGKLKREIDVERLRYETGTEENKAKLSDEEQELLDYIANNGGTE